MFQGRSHQVFSPHKIDIEPENDETFGLDDFPNIQGGVYSQVNESRENLPGVFHTSFTREAL